MRSDLGIRYLTSNRLATPGVVSMLRGVVLDPLMQSNPSEPSQGRLDETVDEPGLVRYEGLDQLQQLGLLNQAVPSQD